MMSADPVEPAIPVNVRKPRMHRGLWWLRTTGLTLVIAAFISFVVLFFVPELSKLRGTAFALVAIGPFLGTAMALLPWAAAASEPSPKGYQPSAFGRTFCVGLAGMAMLVIGLMAAFTLIFA